MSTKGSSEMRVEADVEVAASPEEVWALLEDPVWALLEDPERWWVASNPEEHEREHAPRELRYLKARLEGGASEADR